MKIVIVDTAAAPVLYIVVQKYSCSLCIDCVALEIYRFIMKIFTNIPVTMGDINTRKRNVPCTVSVRFTQL